jgi:SAM-dependent methyltransferase
VLARRVMPPEFLAWNEQWKAPQGRDGGGIVGDPTALSRRKASRLGTFVFQPNSTTRAYEYPWAYHQLPVTTGARILEVGGALSGFQFVLAGQGAHVTNVDPFVDYGGTKEVPRDPIAVHRRICELARVEVDLVRATIDRADLAAASFDAACCISTIEHLSDDDIATVLDEVVAALKPGAPLVLTLDLFLNLAPFSDRTTNQWGTNVSVRQLVERSGLELAVGDPAELYGYDAFDPRTILSRLEEFAIGEGYPQLAQLVVLRKRRS